MGFRKRESDLEQRLRAERPRPSDEFVRSLSKLVEPVRPARGAAMPKLALVGALTVVLAASLGVTGALGAAGGSFSSFGSSIVHLIAPANASPPHVAIVTPQTSSSSSSSSTSTSSSTSSTPQNNPAPGEPDGHGGTDYLNATPHYPPFNFQYGHQIPICWQGHLTYIYPYELFWYFRHGALPYIFCARFH